MMPSRLLIGVAADVTSGGTKTITVTDASGTSANQTTVFDSETLRGRFGYAFDNVLLYGTAGWAWSSNQYVRTQLTGTLNNATAGSDEAVNKYLSGWTAGAGVSVACRAELERVCRISIYEFWIHRVHAAAVGAVNDFDNEGQRHRIRRELHIQRQGTICSRFRGGRRWVACPAL